MAARAQSAPSAQLEHHGPRRGSSTTKTTGTRSSSLRKPGLARTRCWHLEKSSGTSDGADPPAIARQTCGPRGRPLEEARDREGEDRRYEEERRHERERHWREDPSLGQHRANRCGPLAGLATPNGPVREGNCRGEPMTAQEATRYRAILARCNFLGCDRPDIQHTASAAQRWMLRPCQAIVRRSSGQGSSATEGAVGRSRVVGTVVWSVLTPTRIVRAVSGPASPRARECFVK